MFRPRGKFVAVLVATAVLAAIGGAVFAGLPQTVGLASSHRPEEQAQPELSTPGLMYTFKERVVNMADPGGRRYLKVAMSIEFSTDGEEVRKASPEERTKKQAEFDKDIAAQAPVIEDAVISLLAAKTSAEAATSEGKQQLRTEIRDRLNSLLGSDQVTNVYFTQFLMQ